MFEVFDTDGHERDITWLRERYGNVRLLDGGAAPKYALVRVDCTVGPATVTVRVLDEQGNPRAQQPVALSWPRPENPDPNLPSLKGGGLKTLWSDRGVHQ